MPTLADIYSAIDTAKRKAVDVIGNPMSSLAQMAGNANDRARVLNQMTQAAAEEQDLYGPASKALGQKLAEAYNPAGMIGSWTPAYHGTTKEFTSFSPKKSFGDLNVVWTTPEESFAQRYAGKSGKVVRLEVNEGKNFDFSNAEQLEKLKQKAKKIDIYDPLRGMTTLDTKVPDVSDKGSYKVAEHPQLFNLLKKMGYDSVAVYEDGVRNLGFFRPQKNIRNVNEQ